MMIMNKFEESWYFNSSFLRRSFLNSTVKKYENWSTKLI